MQLATKHIERIKEIQGLCRTCKGYGCRACALRVEIINSYFRSAIPIKYWDLKLENFPGDPMFKEWIKNNTTVEKIKEFYKQGISLVFTGKYGVGKTFAACEILKKAAIQLKYTVKYTTMSEIVDFALSKDDRYEFKMNLLNVDFLCIDEVDSRYIPSSDRGQDLFGTNLENIIRTRFQNNLPTFFCTNNSSLNDVFNGAFSQTFESLFSQAELKTIPVGGIDLRKMGKNEKINNSRLL